MGIMCNGLELLLRVSRELGAAKVPGPWPCISLSYQDVIATPEELARILGDDIAAELPIRLDSAAIVRWFKSKHINPHVPEWHELLRRLGFEPTSVDLIQARGCEEYMDLNFPCAPRHHGRYMFVLDCVAQHCFDPAQCLRNVVNMTAVGGYAMHITPLVYVGQGFYSLAPALLRDFHVQNGFEVVEHVWYDSTGREIGPSIPIDAAARPLATLNSGQLFLAKRLQKLPTIQVPMQAKFLKHPRSIIEKGDER